MDRGHPIEVVIKLAHDYGDILTLQFGVYVHVPQNLTDKRVIHNVDFRQMELWYKEASGKLSDGEEIALQSTVRVGQNGRTMHIPMVDFIESATLEDVKATTRTLREFGLNEFFAYDSGRSFHLYCLPLIKSEQLTRFFGRLLILNEPGRPALVDARWIGHRLIAGYGALRWTANSSTHRTKPTRIML